MHITWTSFIDNEYEEWQKKEEEFSELLKWLAPLFARASSPFYFELSGAQLYLAFRERRLKNWKVIVIGEARERRNVERLGLIVANYQALRFHRASSKGTLLWRYFGFDSNVPSPDVLAKKAHSLDTTYAELVKEAILYAVGLEPTEEHLRSSDSILIDFLLPS